MTPPDDAAWAEAAARQVRLAQQVYTQFFGCDSRLVGQLSPTPPTPADLLDELAALRAGHPLLTLARPAYRPPEHRFPERTADPDRFVASRWSAAGPWVEAQTDPVVLLDAGREYHLGRFRYGVDAGILARNPGAVDFAWAVPLDPVPSARYYDQAYRAFHPFVGPQDRSVCLGRDGFRAARRAVLDGRFGDALDVVAAVLTTYRDKGFFALSEWKLTQ